MEVGWPSQEGRPTVTAGAGVTLEIDRLGKFNGGFVGVLVGAALGLAAAQACSYGQDTD